MRNRRRAARFIDCIATFSGTDVIGHPVISIGDVNQLPSYARQTRLPSRVSYDDCHFSIVIASSLKKIAHLNSMRLWSQEVFALCGVSTTSPFRPLVVNSSLIFTCLRQSRSCLNGHPVRMYESPIVGGNAQARRPRVHPHQGTPSARSEMPSMGEAVFAPVSSILVRRSPPASGSVA